MIIVLGVATLVALACVMIGNRADDRARARARVQKLLNYVDLGLVTDAEVYEIIPRHIARELKSSLARAEARAKFLQTAYVRTEAKPGGGFADYVREGDAWRRLPIAPLTRGEARPASPIQQRDGLWTRRDYYVHPRNWRGFEAPPLSPTGQSFEALP